MASVDKVKVGSTSYDISPSKDGTLNGFTSNDAASPSSWTATDVVAASDSNSTIFSKVTTMIKNVRWLYSKLGTTDFSATGQSTVTGALSALQSGLNGKAASSHSHNTSQLPVSSSQTNSNSYIPTSALVYSMQQQINSLNDATSDVSGLIEDLRPGDYNTEPNSRYNNGESLGIWTSVSDVDKFFAKYNNANGYKSTTRPLRLGDYVTIQDGTYNAQWMIAGFDMEAGRAAADGTTYNNGYGICFVPKTQVTTATWNASNTLDGAYKSSTIHTSYLPGIVTKLQGVLGSHLIQRNVLLSNSVDGSYHSNAYTWTTAYATLMSIGQMNGSFAANTNKYDDGEANYKLPVFNFMEFKTGSAFWSRGVWGDGNSAWRVYGGGSVSTSNVNGTNGVRPLIYLR